MKKLTDEQIDFIVDQINNSQIGSNDLKEDLVDHFCCVIEDYMKQEISFKEAYNKAYHVICPNGFDEIHQETIMLLTSKRIIIMKRLMFIIGFIAVILLTTSILFKVLHLPYVRGLIMAAVVFILIELPILGVYFYKNEFAKHISYKLKYIFGFLGTALFLTASVLKMFHWPGSEITFILSLVIINFGFFPFLFYRIYKKSEKSEPHVYRSYKLKNIFGYIGLAMFLTALVFKILHLPGANAFIICTFLIITFGFLPFLFYGMYRKSLA